MARAKADHAARIQQLLQEARSQARVNHPNVVHIYFVDQARDFPFFAMELIRGSTLKHQLANGPLPFAEVVRIAAQLAAALRHALQFDIVHGDVKPGNILQSKSGTVKLSDFGLARRLSKLQPGKGQLIGTPNYLCPEAADQKPVDFRSDMYSLGVTLFELTFGRQPYFYATRLRRKTAPSARSGPTVKTAAGRSLSTRHGLSIPPSLPPPRDFFLRKTLGMRNFPDSSFSQSFSPLAPPLPCRSLPSSSTASGTRRWAKNCSNCKSSPPHGQSPSRPRFAL